jgi:hypothetical protein
MTRQSTPNIFCVGNRVEIVELGEVIDTAIVVADNRATITLRSERLHPGSTTEFAFEPTLRVWRMLFEGMGGERCIKPNGPMYDIRPA